MKKLLATLALVSSSSLITTHVAANEMPSANYSWIQLELGAKQLQEEDAEDLDTQAAVGISGVIGQPDWPVGIYIGALSSGAEAEYRFSDGSFYEELELFELNLGIAKSFATQSNFNPYIAGGVAIGNGEYSYWTSDDESNKEVYTIESAYGFWAGAGVNYVFGSGFTLGGQARYSMINSSFEEPGIDDDVEIGGVSILLNLGYTFN